MKITFEHQELGGQAFSTRSHFGVAGETDRLTEVLLCAPDHLAPVPCCSVTQESLRSGFQTSTASALRQHSALQRTLEASGVRCRMIEPNSDMPDLCFTRDSMVTTPWGVVGLRPAMAHREAEAGYVANSASRLSQRPVERVEAGVIEGGDISIARPGLLIVGISGQRTDEAGAEAFSARFRSDGWEVIHYAFDPHFLHLDTIFCMLGPNRALGCVEVLEDDFLELLSVRGIEVLPVSYKEARKLGCNILSIDGQRIIANSATPRVTGMMREAGFDVVELEIDQFTACGGGVHCMTMPLYRAPTSMRGNMSEMAAEPNHQEHGKHKERA